MTMKRVAKLDKGVANRWKRLGDVGEELTESLLLKNGFTNIRNLNHNKKNFAFADFYAEKEGAKYVISVKTNTPEEWFEKLSAEGRAIEAEVGKILDWDPRSGKAERHIILRLPVRLDGARREQYEWLAEGVDKFHKVFGPRISSFK
jgi:hypothetical protein